MTLNCASWLQELSVHTLFLCLLAWARVFQAQESFRFIIKDDTHISKTPEKQGRKADPVIKQDNDIKSTN